MIKGPIQGDDITLFNIHVPNIGAPKYMKQTVTDIEGKTDGNERILKTLTMVTSMDRSLRQKYQYSYRY